MFVYSTMIIYQHEILLDDKHRHFYEFAFYGAPITINVTVNIIKAFSSYLLKKYSNATFHQFITQKRLDKAKTLINKTEYPIVRIANNCGFSNYGTFIRLFKNEYNMTPNEYRLKNKERN